MPTKKDLLEAQSFSRRRLLTAFTSGAPGGKELEPATPLRAVVAGVVLALMVVVGGVFYGLTNKGLPDGWENNKVLIAKDTGARYVSVNGTLYPVLNATSARLVLPADGYSVITTTSAALKDVPVGKAIGILGAPDDVPAASDLVPEGWTACPVDAGTAVSVPGDADVVPLPAGTAEAATPSAALVSSDGQLYVIAGTYRYQLTEDKDEVLRQIGLTGVKATEVESRWLNLFEAGDELKPLIIDGADEGRTLGNTDLPIGAVVHPQGSTNLFVITADEKLAALSPFAYQLYLLGTGEKLGAQREVTPSDIALPNADAPAGPATWPSAALAPLQANVTMCALLDRDPAGNPVTALASTTVPQVAGVTLKAHTGALVVASGRGGATVGTVALIDDSGTAFPLPNADAETLAKLRYKPEDAASVPLVWTQFFASGPELTQEAAMSTPTGGDAGLATVSPSATPDQPQPSGSPEASATASGTAADGSMVTGYLPLASEGDACEVGVYRYSTEPPVSLGLLQSDASWSRATGKGVVVAVVDSGIDAKNVHFKDAIIGGINLVPDGEAADGTTDTSGHGTAVAGVIAARPYEPDSAVIGLAPDVKLLAVRVFRGDDDEAKEAGYGPDAKRLAQGIVWAVDNGADIINVSMSDDAPSQALEDAAAYATAHGVLIIASAGNRGTAEATVDSPRYPAAYDGVLAVSATDTDGAVTDSSIHGDHVDVSAPGQQILTATTGGGDCTYAANAASASFATGYVSAAAALLAQAYPDEAPAQWAYRLEASALRADPDARDTLAGWGMIQPFDALMLEQGADVRGPQNPDMASAPLTVDPAVADVHLVTKESVWDKTRGAAWALGVVAAIALLGLAIIAVARREPEPKGAPSGRKGLLDDKKDSATRLLS